MSNEASKPELTPVTLPPRGGSVLGPKTILALTEDEDTYNLKVSKNLVDKALNALKSTGKGQ